MAQCYRGDGYVRNRSTKKRTAAPAGPGAPAKIPPYRRYLHVGLFKDNLPLAELVLRIITGKQDLVLLSCETQADMKRVTGVRFICLDAYATDSAGKKYDIEVQQSDTGADPHRARYHSSVMDVENLDETQDYRELPDTYVIFITLYLLRKMIIIRRGSLYIRYRI